MRDRDDHSHKQLPGRQFSAAVITRNAGLRLTSDRLMHEQFSILTVHGLNTLQPNWHTGVMANPKQLALLRKRVKRWNQRKEPDDEDEFVTDLSCADLSGADLYEADLYGANLTGANLTGAILTGARLRRVDLSGANLVGADLILADLSEVTLNRTDFTNALIGNTIFADVNLSEAVGLETSRQIAPSHIGIDTFYRSKGRIPHIFLRGAGVPDDFITHMETLNFTQIELYSLFISYSTHDQEFAERLHADLQVKGVRCWFASHDLRGGKKVHRQIDEAVRSHDRVLLIISEASMASEWVRTEIAITRKREIEQKREVLFPIGFCAFRTIRKWEYFDSDIGKDSAREIREFHIPDFSNWKDHDTYKLAFDRLLRDLKGETRHASA